jgi:hypothetical protein
VQAAGALVEVVGTQFTVSREGEHVTVAVSEGTVRVTTDGRALAVHAGQTWENEAAPRLARGDGAKVAPVSPNPPESAPARAPAVSERQATASESGPTPKPEMIPPAPEVSPIEPAAPAAVEPAPLVAAPSPAAPVRSSERERFETASKLESTRPTAALAIYSELSRGSGPWAANALYASGRLELERGQKSRAKQLLELYGRRFPTGQNTEEARRLLETLR